MIAKHLGESRFRHAHVVVPKSRFAKVLRDHLGLR
jgi:hypothetical protein